MTETCPLTHRAELFLCLSHAFLPPKSPELRNALREHLADDLQTLANELEYDLLAPLTELRETMTAAPEHRLLGIYSALFLNPPAPVSINTGMYLDGGIGGISVQSLEDLQQRHGVARAETFRDFSDHVSVQLELFAYLLGSAAEERAAGHHPQVQILLNDINALRDHILRRWAPALAGDLRKALGKHPEGQPYLALALLLANALEEDARRFPDQRGAPAPDAEALAAAREKAALRERYKHVDMDEIRARLAAQGLSTAHLGNE